MRRSHFLSKRAERTKNEQVNERMGGGGGGGGGRGEAGRGWAAANREKGIFHAVCVRALPQ